MTSIAIIGGSGFNTFADLIPVTGHRQTPYGLHSAPILKGNLTDGREYFFLPRHGEGHNLPPHKVNYRANLWKLKCLGVSKIIACNMVGGISSNMPPDTIVIPDQIIDYTTGREHTFFDGVTVNNLASLNAMAKQSTNTCFGDVQHIDFTFPFSEPMRQTVIDFFADRKIAVVKKAVYGCTQGPRLESAAEISRMKNDGCDIVGMTAMPEAALAKELNIDYISVAIVVNWAAGVFDQILSADEIGLVVKKNIDQIKVIFNDLLRFF